MARKPAVESVGEANGLGDYLPFVGRSTINHYVGSAHAPLIIGKDRFSYVEIAKRTGLPAGRAARLITRIAQEHEARSIRDLYAKSSPRSVAKHGFGHCSLLLLFCLFHSEGLNVHSWARQAQRWKKGGFTTFTTYKRSYAAQEEDKGART